MNMTYLWSGLKKKSKVLLGTQFVNTCLLRSELYNWWPKKIIHCRQLEWIAMKLNRVGLTGVCKVAASSFFPTIQIWPVTKKVLFATMNYHLVCSDKISWTFSLTRHFCLNQFIYVQSQPPRAAHQCENFFSFPHFSTLVSSIINIIFWNQTNPLLFLPDENPVYSEFSSHKVNLL